MNHGRCEQPSNSNLETQTEPNIGFLVSKHSADKHMKHIPQNYFSASTLNKCQTSETAAACGLNLQFNGP